MHPTILILVKPDGSVTRIEGLCEQSTGLVTVESVPDGFQPRAYDRMFIQLPGGAFLVDYLGGLSFQTVE